MVNQLSLGFSRLNVPIANATIDGQLPAGGRAHRPAAGRGRLGVPRGGVRGAERAHAVARHRLARLQRVARELHAAEQPAEDARQARADRRLPDPADVLAPEGAHLRQPGDVRVQQQPDRGLQPRGHAARPRPATPTRASCSATSTAPTSSRTRSAATTGLFPTYAFWLQDNFKVTPKLSLNLGLRYDIMKPYTEKEDRWSFMNAELPNPAVGGWPGALQFAGDGPTAASARRRSRPTTATSSRASASRTSSNERTVFRAAYGIMHTRRGAVGGRGGARNGTGLLGYSANPSFPSSHGFVPAYNWTNGVPAYQKPPFFDPTLNSGFATRPRRRRRRHVRRPGHGRPSAALPELERGLPVRAELAARRSASTTPASNGHFLGGGGRGIWSNQMDPRYLALGNLLTQQATPANIAAARAIVPDVALPYPTFSGTIGQMLRPFPQYSGVTDVYGNVGNSKYNSLQATFELRRANGLTLNVNYTYSRADDDRGAIRTAYNFGDDKAVGVNDQTHIFNAHLRLPGAARRAATSSAAATVRARARRAAGSSRASRSTAAGRPLGLDPRPPATCRTRAPATRTSTPRSPATRASTATGATATCAAHAARVHRPQRVRVARRLHLRQHAAHAGLRPAHPGYFNQDLEHPADVPRRRRCASSSASRPSTCSTTWCSAASTPTSRAPTSAGEHPGQHAARGAAEGPDRVLTGCPQVVHPTQRVAGSHRAHTVLAWLLGP